MTLSLSLSREELERLIAEASPGPWAVASDLPALAIAAGQYRVVQTANQNNYRHFGTSERWHGIESEQNAALIASAPELAAQCLAQMDEIEALRLQVAEKDEALEPAIRFIEKERADYFSCCTVRGDPGAMDEDDREFIDQIDGILRRARAARGKE